MVTEVPPCFYEELMVDLYKGTNTRRKAPELDVGCVQVLWGLWVVRQWRGVCARGPGSYTVCSSSVRPAAASPRGRKSRAE